MQGRDVLQLLIPWFMLNSLKILYFLMHNICGDA